MNDYAADSKYGFTRVLYHYWKIKLKHFLQSLFDKLSSEYIAAKQEQTQHSTEPFTHFKNKILLKTLLQPCNRIVSSRDSIHLSRNQAFSSETDLKLSTKINRLDKYSPKLNT